MNVYNEEESKRARIFQREKRQELQLIIERCNQISFDYVKIPSERNDQVVFGSSKSRRIYLFNEAKTVNSFMRRCFKENFPDPAHVTKDIKKPTYEQNVEREQKSSAVFASKVPRFQENLVMDSSQVYRRKKKVQEIQQVPKINFAPFGAVSPRILMCTRDITVTDVPTCSFNPSNMDKNHKNINYSFGGRITFDKAYDIICSPKVVDPKCDECEAEPKNVYWKNYRVHAILCRTCYNKRLFEIKNKSRGVVEKFKNLQAFQRDFKKKRLCSFYHEHNGTKAATLMQTQKKFLKERQKENFLNTFMKY